MKICLGCKQQLDFTAFYVNARTTDRLSSRCKECTRVANLALRRSNPERYSSVRKETRHKRSERFFKWKAEQKCMFCSETNSCCLDLHHLDPSEKDEAISNVMASWSWERLSQELAKCIVVCRNCHAKIHAGLIILDGSELGCSTSLDAQRALKTRAGCDEQPMVRLHYHPLNGPGTVVMVRKVYGGWETEAV